MSPLIAGEYVPRNMRVAMAATRLANAEQARLGYSSFRYTIDHPIHEACDPELNLRILDHLEGSTINVPELLSRLPLDLSNLAQFS